MSTQDTILFFVGAAFTLVAFCTFCPTDPRFDLPLAWLMRIYTLYDT